MNTSKTLNGRVLISDELGRDCFNTQLLYFTCSSLSADDERIYLISDRDGHPNVWMHDMFHGTDRKLTDNQKGILKSYVYFDGTQDEGILHWGPLCKHDSDWLGQDAHPHPIYDHAGDRIFFNSRMTHTVNVYAVSARTPQ